MTVRTDLTKDNVDTYDMAVRIWVGGMGADNKKRCNNMVKQIIDDNVKLSKLESENKQLKKKLEKIDGWFNYCKSEMSAAIDNAYDLFLGEKK